MKPKTMILMGLAITCGLGASWMTSRLIAGRQVEEQETVKILVASKNLNVGELLKKPEDFFVLKDVNAKEVPEGAVKSPEDIKDKIMKRSLRKGDHITALELYGKDDQLDMPEGYNAVGIRVNLETTASGFASLPRSRVDIIHVVSINNNDVNLSYVQVLLEDVLVLAADTTIDREKGPSAQAQVVTVALKPEDAIRIAGAKRFGDLTLALRKPGDHSKVEAPVLTFAEIKAGKNHRKSPGEQVAKNNDGPTVEAPVVQPELPPVAQPEPVEVPKIFTDVLRIVNGTQESRTEFYRTEDGKLIEMPPQQPGEAAAPAVAPMNENRPQNPPSRVRRGPTDL